MSNAAAPLLSRLDSDHPALVVGGRTTRRADLHRRTLGLASWARTHGMSPGDRVLLLVPAGPDFAAALLALVWIGAVPVLLDPAHPPAVWRAQLGAAAPAFAVVDRRLRWAWRLPGLVSWLRARGRPVPPRLPRAVRVLPLPRSASGTAPEAPRAPGDEALILFTSGTTSAPRGVVHTHGSVPAFLGHVGHVVRDLPHRSYLAETPQQIFYALLLDATCHVVRGTGEARLQRTLALLASGGIEAWFGSPWTWVRWLRQGLPVPAALRTVLLGSAPVTRPFLRRLVAALHDDARVRCVYGLTEAGPVCAIDAPQKLAWQGEGDLVGLALPGIDLRSRTDRTVEVRSAALAPRTLDGSPIGPWLDTGDLGRVTDAGLVLEGRRKDMIVRRAVNLYPGVLEPPLLEVLDDVALVGVYDHDAHDERVVLCHVGALPAELDALLGAAAPDHTLSLDALPRAGRQHKVDKAALRELARARFGIP